MVTPWDFVNGVVHFIAYKRRSGRHQNLVMGFHMGDELLSPLSSFQLCQGLHCSMTQYDQNYTKDPPLPTPPNPYAAPQMAVYPTKDGQNPPGKTNSKGSGFWIVAACVVTVALTFAFDKCNKSRKLHHVVLFGFSP
ncbi:hypothetical protein SCA6_018448 [Theobroma cacao]